MLMEHLCYLAPSRRTERSEKHSAAPHLMQAALAALTLRPQLPVLSLQVVDRSQRAMVDLRLPRAAVLAQRRAGRGVGRQRRFAPQACGANLCESHDAAGRRGRRHNGNGARVLACAQRGSQCRGKKHARSVAVMVGAADRQQTVGRCYDKQEITGSSASSKQRPSTRLMYTGSQQQPKR